MDLIIILLFLSTLSASQGLALEGEEGKRQGLIPFPRVGRTMNPWIPVLYHSDLDDVEDKRQVMVPYPRIGRTSLSPWMTSAYQPSDLDDKQEFNIPDDLLTVRYTRGGLFTPRLGRRKRSTDDMTENSRDSMMDNTSLSGKSKQLGDLLRRTSWAIVAYKDGVDKKMIFNPRLGRAMSTSRMGQVRPEDVDDEDDTSKRASAFAPRLGRAYRINEPLSLEQATPFEVSSRAAFSPRLGRGHGYEQTRASAFAPRLGRSDSLLSSTTSDNAEQSNA